MSAYEGAWRWMVGTVAAVAVGVSSWSAPHEPVRSFVALPAAWILLRSAAGAPDVRPLSVK